MTQEDYFDLGLPKWPQMLVSGKQVTVEQAEDIIFKTDAFLTDPDEYSGGNFHSFNSEYRKQAGLEAYREKFEWDTRPLHDNLKVVHTEYVNNSWGSSCFVYGPHGWCRPDGVIEHHYNVGKWPSVEDVYTDWLKVATAFPFLDLHVTLMDDEYCEDNVKPIVNMHVCGGTVTLSQGDVSVHDFSDIEDFSQRLFDQDGKYHESYELGLPLGQYTKYAARVKIAVDEILSLELPNE